MFDRLLATTGEIVAQFTYLKLIVQIVFDFQFLQRLVTQSENKTTIRFMMFGKACNGQPVPPLSWLARRSDTP